MASQETSNQSQEDNLLELLLFYVGGEQRFGINVLKVKEVITCPTLTKLPDSHPAVRGIFSLRGESISVVDLAHAIGRKKLTCDEDGVLNASVVVTEINRTKQGLLVERVDRIISREWKDVLPPPKGLGARSYSSGVSKVDDELVQILDMERIMVEVNQEPIFIPDDIENRLPAEFRNQCVLIVDDSSMARSQTAKILEQLQLRCVMAIDGKEALELLLQRNAADAEPADKIALVVSDIEMPEMDGYNMTKAIRANATLSNLYILLHTSLNGAINTDRAQQSGANDFLTKFVPNDLVEKVVQGFQHQTGKAAEN